MPITNPVAMRTLTDVLFDDATVGRCLVAPDGTVVRANAEWLRSTGFTAEHVVGSNIIELFPETREVALAMHARARAGFRVEVPRHAVAVDGSKTWWDGSIEPVPMEGGTGLLITARPAGTEFQLFYETAPVPCLVLAPDRPRFTIVAASEAYLRATETTRDVIGRGIFEVFPDDPNAPESTANPARSSFERVLDTGASDTMPVQTHAVRRPSAEGGGFEEHHWSPINTPILDGDGKVLFIHHALRAVNGKFADLDRERERRDITEQKRAEEALRASEVRLRAAFGALVERVVFLNARGEVEQVNEVAPCHGDTLDELTIPELDPRGRIVRADGTPFPVDEQPAILALRTGQPVLNVEMGLPARGGPLRWWLVNAQPVRDERGTVVGSVASFFDITERKRAQQELERARNVLSEAQKIAHLGSFEYVAATRTTVWSDEEYRIYGLDPAGPSPTYEVMLARNIHPDDAALLDDVFRKAMQSHSIYELEHRIVRPDGGVRWVYDRAYPYFGEHGELLRYVGATLDITDRKLAEEALRHNITELKRTQDALREADRRKDEFLGMLSHELRNPLAPIRNSTYILQHTAPGSDQAHRAQAIIQRQTEHLTRLVDDLLDVTRIVRGKIELKPECVDLRDVVLRTAEDYRPMLDERGVVFRTDLPHDAVWANVDPARITQIVGNLLHNASKFTRCGDAVSLCLNVSAEGYGEIRVRDTGRGIDPELLPRVFEPFVQGERTLARTEGGLGLGLAMVRGMAALHGGSARAESAGRGQGAEFIVRLPLQPEPQPHDAAGPTLERGDRGRRVLVVDDNRDAAESLAAVVKLFGYAVEVAYDGPSAIEKTRAKDPKIVLCDLGLPGMSGYEVARALRAAAPHGLQLIAVSGYAQPEDVKRAIDAGFDGHIAKPCDPEKIERLLA